MGKTAKQVVQDFAQAQRLDTVGFANKFGYSYQQAWNLLRGKSEPGPTLVTRMIQKGYVNAARELAQSLEMQTA